MLSCGNTRGYELLAAGKLESFVDGRSRKITVASIHRYIERHLTEERERAAAFVPKDPKQSGGRP